LDLSSRDSINGFNLGDADASIWVKGEQYKKFPKFHLAAITRVGSALQVAVTYVEIFCMPTVYQNKSGRKPSSHLSEISSHLILRSAAEAIA
jgi:hypothetical protein